MKKTAYVIINRDHKIFLLIIVITFSIFLFTSDGHRFTSDEYLTFNQAERILTQTPIPNFVPGVTRIGLQEPGFINWSMPTCKDAILCSGIPIGYVASYIPFIFLEQNVHIMPNYFFTEEDFNDLHYVKWRNSMTHEETFTFLFYGSTITAISTSILFLLCRTYDFSRKISTTISFLYGFTTIAWAYSNTAFSSVLVTLFFLSAFFFFRKFKKNNTAINLIFCGSSLGVSVLVRYDAVIFCVILLAFLIRDIIRKEEKIKNLVNLIGPILFCGFILLAINFIQFGSFSIIHGEADFLLEFPFPHYLRIFGLLFSPGAGLFVFSPILLTIFVSFFDFYRKDKNDLLIFSIYFIALLIFYAIVPSWHGFVSWSVRYMVPVIPFLVLPLALSIEKRKNTQFRICVLVLGIIGAFFSFIWLVQDVSWFVWGPSGGNSGLFSLGIAGMHPLNLNPIVLWTFEYSQLTHAIILAFTDLQVDLFLFKMIGFSIGFFILSLIVIPSSFFLLRLLKDSDITSFNSKKEFSKITGSVSKDDGTDDKR